MPIAVNLNFLDEEETLRKVSPPFEGGVVGMVDYHIYTVFYFPTGVVDSLIFFTFTGMKNKNLFNRKSLKFFRSSLRNKSTSAEAQLWNIIELDGDSYGEYHNQPPRPVSEFLS